MTTNLDKLKQLRKETSLLANRIMMSPHTSEEEFAEAFRLRDLNYVESIMDDMDEDERAQYLAEARWETQCGCNGEDSPFHTYFSY